MANEETKVDLAEVYRCICIEELSGKICIASSTFNILKLTNEQNYVIGNEEVKNIIEYILDTGVHDMKNKCLMERLYLA